MSKRLAWVVLGTACLLLLGSSSASATNTIHCGGTTSLAEKSLRTHSVDYQFSCSEAITGFGVATNRRLEGFSPETLVLDRATKSPANGESFGCEGPIPGLGFACVGTSTKPRLVRGSFTTEATTCSKKEGRLESLLYVTDSDKRLAGVWKLKSPKCPKPKKKKRSAKH